MFTQRTCLAPGSPLRGLGWWEVSATLDPLDVPTLLFQVPLLVPPVTSKCLLHVRMARLFF